MSGSYVCHGDSLAVQARAKACPLVRESKMFVMVVTAQHFNKLGCKKKSKGTGELENPSLFKSPIHHGNKYIGMDCKKPPLRSNFSVRKGVGVELPVARDWNQRMVYTATIPCWCCRSGQQSIGKQKGKCSVTDLPK